MKKRKKEKKKRNHIHNIYRRYWSKPDYPADLDVVNYNADFNLLVANPSFVTEAQLAGITVFAWTLNNEE